MLPYTTIEESTCGKMTNDLSTRDRILNLIHRKARGRSKHTMPLNRSHMRRYYELILVCILILVSVGVRFHFADFSKHLLVYTDELRYLSLAESIAEGNGLAIYNSQSGFQKIFYSVLLAPAYLVSDRVVSIRIVTLINVCLMSSGIIPLWLLGRKFLSSGILRLLLCVIYLFGSDMVYSITFMSENLYIPMAIWLIYFLDCLFVCNGYKKKTVYSILIGIYIFTMYLTKEIALVFLIAIPVLRCMDYVYTRIQCDGEEKVYFADVFLECVGVIATFLVCHLLFKSTLFAGWGNSYNQTSVDILWQDGRIRYLLYGFFYYLCSCIVAFGVLPILMPLVKFRGLSHREKRLYMLLILLVIGTAVTIAYTITIREDFGLPYQETPRAHIRYISYAVWPLLMLLFSLFQKKERASVRSLLSAALFTSVFGLIFVMFWKGAFDASTVDQTSLTYLLGLDENRLLLFCLALVIGAICAVLFFDVLKVLVIAVFLVFFIGVQLFNNAEKIQSYQNNYAMSNVEFEDTAELGTFIREHKNDTFIVVSDLQGKTRRLMDTYVNYDNMYTIAWSQISSLQQQGRECEFYELECRYNGMAYGIQSGDYLVLERDNAVVLSDNKYSKVLSNDHYTVYDIRGTETLPQMLDRSVLITGDNIYTPDTYWPFDSQEDGLISTGAKALVFGPYMTLPAGTYNFEIYYSYEGEPVAADTVVGYCDIFSGAVGLDWAQYVTNATASGNVVSIEQVEFTSDIPQFELRMMTYVAGVKVEKIIIHKM